jgi:mediator of RNA polymerase II transcription subunit 13
MDALKGCMSNVHVLKDVDTTRYRLYVCQEWTSSGARLVSRTITELRSEDVMCSAKKDRVWIFNSKEEEPVDHLVKGFRLESEGTIAERSQPPFSSEPPIFPTFLDALEASITFVLSRAHNAIKLSAWAWFLPDIDRQNPGLEAHIQIQLADDGRKLSIATVMRTSDLVSAISAHLSKSSDIIIAPSGMSAAVFIQGNGDADHEKVERNTFAFGDDQWKASVCEGVAAEGISLDDDASWLSVVPFGSRTAVYWPLSLCFVQRENPTFQHANGSNVGEWRCWFDLPEVTTFDDPLSFAEEWTTTFAERELQLHSQEASRHEDLNMNDISSDPARIGSTTFDVTSPPLTNRPDLQALHGIYPTPPDGLGMHGAAQLQLQSENTAAPAGDLGHVQNFTVPDTAPDNSVQLFDRGTDIEADQLQRNHSIASSIGPHAQDWNHESTDDLFGDMDDIEYGREEVGDADFNFFDEPDAEPMKDNAEASYGVALGSTDAGHVAMLDELQDNVPLLKPGEATDSQPSSDLRATENTVQGDEADHASLHSPSGNHSDAHALSTHHEEQSTTGLYNVKAQQSDNSKPLSPFGIKEALLPAPIPASASHGHSAMVVDRRRSSFGPLVFNTGNNFAPHPAGDYSDIRRGRRSSSYDLGPTRVPLASISESSVSIDTPSSLDDAESEVSAETDQDNDTMSMASEDQHVAEDSPDESVSFYTRKRKRTLDTSSYCGPQTIVVQQGGRPQVLGAQNGPDGLQGDIMQGMIRRLLRSSGISDVSRPQVSDATSAMLDGSGRRILDFGQLHHYNVARSEHRTLNGPGTTADVTHTFAELRKNDLVVLGQIVAEQAVAVVRKIAVNLAASTYEIINKTNRQSATIRNLGDTLESISSALIMCDVASLAPIREPFQVQRPQAAQLNTNMASHARQPQPQRQPPRVDSTALGPDILPLTASFIRANRNESSWEMAPTALIFWEALGLSPASGPKDIRHFCISPDNPALEYPVADFLRNLKAAYEGCKFGSMAIGIDNGNTSPSDDIEYLHPVTLDSSAVPSHVTAMQAYWNACTSLGTELADMAFDEPCRTLVVSMISPFPLTTKAEWATTTHHFGACFLNLSKSYHAAASRDKRFNGKDMSQRQISDIDFKILPISLVASSSGLAVLNSHQMALLARELYDRCPPSSDNVTESSPLSNIAAPSVELVAPLPKRISFQLSSDLPTDLLHEASVLHVAYATSTDGRWANVIWHDNTGRYANSSALCMQGRSFADIALEVWKRTVDLIKARDVIWRIFIATDGGDGIEPSRANCWKDIIAQNTDRKQLLSVTLLHFQRDLALSITGPADSHPAQGPGSGAPTPAATPQPGSGQAVSTTSPDAISTSNAPVTAPPTPAPSEVTSNILEADPDAHLIETEDETWGMLIDRDVASTLRPLQNSLASAPPKPNYITALAHSVLIKRGKHSIEGGGSFPCVGASLIWTLRVRPKSDRQGSGARPNVDEGSARHAEVMLREVLGMFRNLGLLSKVKGLDPSGLVPVHVIAATEGAEGLNGLLREHVEVDVDVD